MRISTGVPGLDDILKGGLLPGRVYLVHGKPGTGKRTLGLHFLSTAEAGLFITLDQSAEHVRCDAGSLGLNISAVSILDLTPTPEMFSEMKTYDIFSPFEVEREPITRQMAKVFEEVNPKRIFVDGFGMFRHLSSDALVHSRLAQSFFRFATGQGGTLIVASEDSECARYVDGVIELKFSDEGRSVQVTKFRGSDFREGRHPMRLSNSGLQISLNAA